MELPEDQRRVMELRLSGLTSPEAGRVLGRSPTAVRSLQFRAVERLRTALRDSHIAQESAMSIRGGGGGGATAIPSCGWITTSTSSSLARQPRPATRRRACGKHAPHPGPRRRAPMPDPAFVRRLGTTRVAVRWGPGLESLTSRQIGMGRPTAAIPTLTRSAAVHVPRRVPMAAVAPRGGRPGPGGPRRLSRPHSSRPRAPPAADAGGGCDLDSDRRHRAGATPYRRDRGERGDRATEWSGMIDVFVPDGDGLMVPARYPLMPEA